MTAKRIAAVLLAAALIVAAVLIRNGLDDNSSSATDSTSKPSGGKATVICSTEFKAICDGLDPSKYTASTESAGTTLDSLAKSGATLPDAWITLDPFPEMIDVLRGEKSLSLTAPTVRPVATDVPVLAASKPLFNAIGVLCGGTVNWKCAGTNAGKPLDGGGKLLPGITNPDIESNGLLAFANAVAGYFGQAALSTSAWQDFAFTGWLRSLQTNVNVAAAGATPLSTLVLRRTAVNVAATTQSEAKSSPQPGQFTVVPITPSINYTAVVATFGPKAESLAATVGPALVGTGWIVADGSTPLPDPGTFIALRRLWEGK